MSSAEDETCFSLNRVTAGLSVTRKRSRQLSAVNASTTSPAGVLIVTPDSEPEDPYPAKRQRLAEQQAQSPILEPTPTPESSSLLDLGGQASRSRVSDSPISGSLGATHEGDGDISQVLPLADLRDKEDDSDAYVQGTLGELLQARGSIPPPEGTEGEQDVGRDSVVAKLGEPLTRNSITTTTTRHTVSLQRHLDGVNAETVHP
jgi:hypothetical protein